MAFRKYLTQFSIAVALLLISFLGQAESGIDFFHGSFDEAKQMAKEQGKIIFMDAYASWCGPCKRMAANVFPLQDVGDFYNEHFINLKIDMEKGEGRAISQAYGVNVYPTLLYLDSEGNLVHRTVGGKSAESLVAEGQKALMPGPELVKRITDAYESGDKSTETLRQYAEILYKSGKPHEVVFLEYLQSVDPSEVLNDRNSKAILGLTNSPYSNGMPYLKDYRKFYIDTYGEGKYFGTVLKAVKNGIQTNVQNNDENGMKESVSLLKTLKHPEQGRLSIELPMQYYKGVKDWVSFDKEASKLVSKYIGEDLNEMRSLINTYQNEITDESICMHAKAWSEKLVKQEDSYENNILYARVLTKLKLHEDALVFAQLSKSMAEKNGLSLQDANALIQYLQSVQAK